MSFISDLAAAWRCHDSLVCVGLDPEPSRLPESLKNHPDAVFEFCRAIIDATADLVCAFKPQFAHFAALRAENTLERLITYIHGQHPDVPVILDAKRGDIGSTAKRYAIEAFERYQADAVTLNPYLGFDSIEPFLQYADKGVILLCRTSNNGSADFQSLVCDGRPLYLHIADTIARRWNMHGNCALVTGATWPQEIGQVRTIVGDMPLLVPGVGAQGGDLEGVLQYGLNSENNGLLISSSRAILYASRDEDFAEAARRTTLDLRNKINQHRSGQGL